MTRQREIDFAMLNKEFRRMLREEISSQDFVTILRRHVGADERPPRRSARRAAATKR